MEDYVIYGLESEKAPDGYVKLEDVWKSLEDLVQKNIEEAKKDISEKYGSSNKFTPEQRFVETDIWLRKAIQVVDILDYPKGQGSIETDLNIYHILDPKKTPQDVSRDALNFYKNGKEYIKKSPSLNPLLKSAEKISDLHFADNF